MDGRGYEEYKQVLRDILRLIDEGVLVRNATHDIEPEWVLRCLPLITVLARARELSQ